ncbi:APH(3') family aminoglycoside O-phosphotransferase [Polymorphospora sp. NPDC051019]|uniref:APH(3') family aminoglycoside O-phosphotransferase n=1 Tax=Polymorphospora sp. NPDC051019 TaxID=3155725 RepID=UPI00341639DA
MTAGEGDAAASWEPVTAGRSGARVWRGTDRYRKHGDPAGIAAEAHRLTWLAGRRVPCPRVVGHRPGELVTTAVPGRPAVALTTAAARDRAVDSLADLLRTLHDLPVRDCPFDMSLAVTVPAAEAAVTAGTVDLADLDDVRRGWSADRLRAELHRTRPASEDLVVCHNDLTLTNVLVADDGTVTGVVDVARLGVADRHSDLALVTRDLAGEWHPYHAARFLTRYGPSRTDQAKIDFFQLLDEFF